MSSFPCIQTVAGCGHRGMFDGGGLLKSHFSFPSEILELREGAFIIADSKNNCLRFLDLVVGRTYTIKTNPFLLPRSPVLIDSDTFVVCDSGHNRIRLLRFRFENSVPVVYHDIVLAGSGRSGYEDGPAVSARFHHPVSICLLSDRSLAIVDRGNHCVRRLAARMGSAGLYVSTLVGRGGTAGFEDGDSDSARLYSPEALVMDGHGVLLLSDAGNFAVRALHAPKDLGSRHWALTTLVGYGANGHGGFRDGASALEADLGAVGGLVVNQALASDSGVLPGHLLLSDTSNGCIRALVPFSSVHLKGEEMKEVDLASTYYGNGAADVIEGINDAYVPVSSAPAGTENSLDSQLSLFRYDATTNRFERLPTSSISDQDAYNANGDACLLLLTHRRFVDINSSSQQKFSPVRRTVVVSPALLALLAHTENGHPLRQLLSLVPAAPVLLHSAAGYRMQELKLMEGMLLVSKEGLQASPMSVVLHARPTAVARAHVRYARLTTICGISPRRFDRLTLASAAAALQDPSAALLVQSNLHRLAGVASGELSTLQSLADTDRSAHSSRPVPSDQLRARSEENDEFLGAMRSLRQYLLDRPPLLRRIGEFLSSLQASTGEKLGISDKYASLFVFFSRRKEFFFLEQLSSSDAALLRGCLQGALQRTRDAVSPLARLRSPCGLSRMSGGLGSILICDAANNSVRALLSTEFLRGARAPDSRSATGSSLAGAARALRLAHALTLPFVSDILKGEGAPGDASISFSRKEEQMDALPFDFHSLAFPPSESASVGLVELPGLTNGPFYDPLTQSVEFSTMHGSAGLVNSSNAPTSSSSAPVDAQKGSSDNLGNSGELMTPFPGLSPLDDEDQFTLRGLESARSSADSSRKSDKEVRISVSLPVPNQPGHHQTISATFASPTRSRTPVAALGSVPPRGRTPSVSQAQERNLPNAVFRSRSNSLISESVNVQSSQASLKLSSTTSSRIARSTASRRGSLQSSLEHNIDSFSNVSNNSDKVVATTTTGNADSKPTDRSFTEQLAYVRMRESVLKKHPELSLFSPTRAPSASMESLPEQPATPLLAGLADRRRRQQEVLTDKKRFSPSTSSSSDHPSHPTSAPLSSEEGTVSESPLWEDTAAQLQSILARETGADEKTQLLQELLQQLSLAQEKASSSSLTTPTYGSTAPAAPPVVTDRETSNKPTGGPEITSVQRGNKSSVSFVDSNDMLAKGSDLGTDLELEQALLHPISSSHKVARSNNRRSTSRGRSNTRLPLSSSATTETSRNGNRERGRSQSIGGTVQAGPVVLRPVGWSFEREISLHRSQNPENSVASARHSRDVIATEVTSGAAALLREIALRRASQLGAREKTLPSNSGSIDVDQKSSKSTTSVPLAKSSHVAGQIALASYASHTAASAGAVRARGGTAMVGLPAFINFDNEALLADVTGPKGPTTASSSHTSQQSRDKTFLHTSMLGRSGRVDLTPSVSLVLDENGKVSKHQLPPGAFLSALARSAVGASASLRGPSDTRGFRDFDESRTGHRRSRSADPLERSRLALSKASEAHVDVWTPRLSAAKNASLTQKPPKKVVPAVPTVVNHPIITPTHNIKISFNPTNKSTKNSSESVTISRRRSSLIPSMNIEIPNINTAVTLDHNSIETPTISTPVGHFSNESRIGEFLSPTSTISSS